MGKVFLNYIVSIAKLSINSKIGGCVLTIPYRCYNGYFFRIIDMGVLILYVDVTHIYDIKGSFIITRVSSIAIIANI